MKIKAIALLTMFLGVFSTLGACTDQPFTIDVPLRVVSISPSAEATDVGRDDLVISIAFSEELAEATLGTAFTLEAIGGEVGTADAPVAIDMTLSYVGGESNIVELTPSARLDYSTDYRLTINTDVERKRDNGPLPVVVGSLFSMEDPAVFSVIGVTPANGGLGIDRQPAITLTFSEPPNCDSLNAGYTLIETLDAHPRFASVTAGEVAGSWTCPAAAYDPADLTASVACTAGDCVATFVPTDAAFEFHFSSLVKITLNGGTRDDAAVESLRATARNGQLADTLTFEFEILHPPYLSLVSSAPQDAGTGAALVGAIDAVFSEGVRCASFVEPATFSITEELDPHAHYGDGTGTMVEHFATVACVDGESTVTFDTVDGSDANLDFQYSSLVTVNLVGGLHPDAIESARATTQGGQLATDVAINFRAEDPPALLVTGASPGGAADGIAIDANITISFSEPVECNTIDNSSFVVVETPDTGSAITHTCNFTCDNTSNIVVCDP
ncbi:Ig-like domain-containing protein [Myxococcota bacterium]|nr:Ig-like domain-containing protein [Myxococcota bacterium]